jgi:hypothetical protein
MKLFGFAGTAFLLFVLGAAVPAYAQEHPDDAAKPHDQAEQPKDEAKPPEKAKPKPQPAKDTHAQQDAEHKNQEDAKKQQDAKHEEEVKHQPAAKNTEHADNHAGRIPDDRYRAHFGENHHFRIGHPTIVEGHPHFSYGGYSFIIGEAWPVGWGYDDDVYVVDVNGVYYLYNVNHPGAQVVLTVVL